MRHPIYESLFKPRLRKFAEYDNSETRLLLSDDFGNQIEVREFERSGKSKDSDYYRGTISIPGAEYVLESNWINSFVINDITKCLSIYYNIGRFDDEWLFGDLVQSIAFLENAESTVNETSFECFIRVYPLLKPNSFRFMGRSVFGLFSNERLGFKSDGFNTLENLWKDCVFNKSVFMDMCNRVPFISERQSETIRKCLNSNKCINKIYDRTKKSVVEIGSTIHTAVIKTLSGAPIQCNEWVANIAQAIADKVRGKIIPTYKNYSTLSTEQHCPDGSRPDIILRDSESNVIALIEIKTTTNPTKSALDEKVNEHIEHAKKSALSLEPCRDVDIWFIVANQETGSVEFKKVEPDKPRTTQQIMYDLMPMNMLRCYTVV